MTEYAYSRKEPCISSTTSMSRIFSSYESSGGGVFVLRRAIAAAAPSQSLPGHERVLTRTIVDRRTDNADRDPSIGASRSPVPIAHGERKSGLPPQEFSLSAYEVRELRHLSARLHTVAGPAGILQFPRSKGRTCP